MGLVGTGEVIDYKNGGFLLYTTTATNILRAKYVNIAGVKDLGVINT